MSTLTSKDINLERSSTRLHAPPGGQSSIVFGDSGGKFFLHFSHQSVNI